jgi:hypothetical protein
MVWCQESGCAVLERVASISLQKFTIPTLNSSNSCNYSIKDLACKRSTALRKENFRTHLATTQLRIAKHHPNQNLSQDVPEGRCDHSLARSAWDSPTTKESCRRGACRRVGVGGPGSGNGHYIEQQLEHHRTRTFQEEPLRDVDAKASS